MPALATCRSLLRGSNTAYWMAACRRGMPRIRRRRLKVARALPGEVPVFWACGVTPQAVALAANVPLMITHAPGHMFITDIPIERLES